MDILEGELFIYRPPLKNWLQLILAVTLKSPKVLV